MITIGVRTFVRPALIAGFVLAGVVTAEVSAGGGGNAVIDPEERAALTHGGHDVARDVPDAEVEDAVRAAVFRYTSREIALDDGFEPCGVCGPDGRYYVNGDASSLVNEDVEPDSPLVLWYEPLGDGRPTLVAVKYAVSVDAWHDAGRNRGPPTLLGRSFVRDDDFLEEPVYLIVVPVDRYRPLDGLLR